MNSALSAAAAEGNLVALRWLLARGATNVTAALTCAASHGCVAAMQLLHQHGAAIAIGSVERAASHGHAAALPWLLDRKSATDDWSYIALAHTAEAGEIMTIQCAVMHGATTLSGALALAAEGRYHGAVQYLLDQGANLEAAINGAKRCHMAVATELLMQRARDEDKKRAATP